jgi:hypothetical protein
MANARSTNATAASEHALPLVIAVTGHRNLLASETPRIRARIRRLLTDLGERYPDRRLSIISPLAEGADRLVAEEALALGLKLVVPLPMPPDLYVDDFGKAESREQFESLCKQASDVFVLPLARGNSLQDIRQHGLQRNRQYAQLGIFLCAHCHILLALWDGKHSSDLGGTGQVVRFHHDDIMPGYTTTTIATQQMLIDDESDLVFHIVCSRDQPDGTPHEDLQPLDYSWFTKDKDHPRTRELPRQHQTIFKRSSEFSRDAMKFASRIEAEKYPLLDDADVEDLPEGIGNIDRIFCISDWRCVQHMCSHSSWGSCLFCTPISKHGSTSCSHF